MRKNFEHVQGYSVTADLSPCRIELYHPKLGYLDIHPLDIAADGSAKQADPYGGWFKLEAFWFDSAVFEERDIPWVSAEAQLLYHSGYELQEKGRLTVPYIR